MIKALILDFDGVIAESVDIKTKAFARLFAKESKSVLPRIIRYHLANAGVSRFEKFRHIYKRILKRNLGDSEFRRLCADFSCLVKEQVIAAPYVRGAREFLDKYACRYRCYMLSATPRKEIEEIARAKKIRRFFKMVYGAPAKKQQVVKEIMRREGLRPCEVLYVGDALSDYEAARKNGVNFIARIHHNAALFDAIDCLKIKDLKRLTALIKKL
jgi:HAD superfamily hydrolase (TIGR01549 family)